MKTQEALATFNPATIRTAGIDLLEHVANDAPALSPEELYLRTSRAAELLRLAWLLEEPRSSAVVLRSKPR